MEIKKVLKKISLLLLSVILFVLANPNFIFEKGLGFLAFIYFLPVLILIRYSSFKELWCYGGIYGALSYGFYAYWLHNFDPLCLIIVCIFYFIIMALMFELLKTVDVMFRKNGWLVQWSGICAYEYIKTLGFLGFNYGVTAYTQWKNIYFIRVANIIGPFGVSAIVIFSSCLASSYILKAADKKQYLIAKHNYSNEFTNNDSVTNIQKHFENEKVLNNLSLKNTNIFLGIWLFVMLFCFTYGKVCKHDYSNYKQIKIVAIQSNESPWKNGIDVQTKDIQRLMALTDEALELNPDIKVIVWPETAVVPAIQYQYETKKDERKFQLINLLLQYIDSKNATFVIGNGHEVNSFKPVHDIYNSALVFTPGENVIPPKPIIYSKIKLVPFSESFPYKKFFPSVYKALLKKNTHMWTPGKEYKCFYKEGLFFSTPICFEDTFPFTGRKMFTAGARCFVNLSNDSWSNSVACQNQHLAMAVFRSVENAVPSVRSTTSGQSCIINPDGKITGMCTPFTYSYVVGNVPVIPQFEKPTIYNQIGDVFGYISVTAFLILLIIRLIFVIIEKSN